MIAPIKWHYGLAIKDANDPFIVALREGRIEPGETEVTILGGSTYVVFPPFKDELPDGLTERDGCFYFDCNRCESETEWYGEPDDFEFGAHENLCGGNPWCCP